LKYSPFLGNLEMVDILLEAGADLAYENAVGTDISQNVIIDIFHFTSVNLHLCSVSGTKLNQ
jgi:hypothetical protein